MLFSDHHVSRPANPSHALYWCTISLHYPDPKPLSFGGSIPSCILDSRLMILELQSAAETLYCNQALTGKWKQLVGKFKRLIYIRLQKPSNNVGVLLALYPNTQYGQSAEPTFPFQDEDKRSNEPRLEGVIDYCPCLRVTTSNKPSSNNVVTIIITTIL